MQPAGRQFDMPALNAQSRIMVAKSSLKRSNQIFYKFDFYFLREQLFFCDYGVIVTLPLFKVKVIDCDLNVL